MNRFYKSFGLYSNYFEIQRERALKVAEQRDKSTQRTVSGHPFSKSQRFEWIERRKKLD